MRRARITGADLLRSFSAIHCHALAARRSWLSYSLPRAVPIVRPPIDMLAQLDPFVVVLSEHVDYWDRQGWKDRFSSRRIYGSSGSLCQALPDWTDPYTPQMVVDGAAQFVGSDAKRAQRGDRQGAGAAQSAGEAGCAPPVECRSISRMRPVPQACSSRWLWTAPPRMSRRARTRAGIWCMRRCCESLRKIGSVKRGAGFSQLVPLPATAAEQRVVVFVQEGTSWAGR